MSEQSMPTPVDPQPEKVPAPPSDTDTINPRQPTVAHVAVEPLVINPRQPCANGHQPGAKGKKRATKPTQRTINGRLPRALVTAADQLQTVPSDQRHDKDKPKPARVIDSHPPAATTPAAVEPRVINGRQP